MVEKILNNTTPYGKIRASYEGSLHSSTLRKAMIFLKVPVDLRKTAILTMKKTVRRGTINEIQIIITKIYV